ncbi:cobalamin biosynthesis protein [compost metagenome]
MNIRIGGPTSYFGKIVEKPYIGEEVEELKGVHIIKSIKLLYVSTVIFIGIYALVLINI